MRDSPVRTIWKSKKHGVCIQCCADHLVKTVLLYSGNKDGFCRFQGPLIAGITFQSYRDNIVRALGSPSTSGSPGAAPILGPHGGWDRYDRESYSIHFSYSVTTKMLELVTIMAPDSCPGNSRGDCPNVAQTHRAGAPSSIDK